MKKLKKRNALGGGLELSLALPKVLSQPEAEAIGLVEPEKRGLLDGIILPGAEGTSPQYVGTELAQKLILGDSDKDKKD